MFAINHSWREVLNQYYKVYSAEPFGPSGIHIRFKEDPPVNTSRGQIYVTQSDVSDDHTVEWLHASISFPDKVPEYADMAILHRAVFGRKRYSYQLFVPESSHINIHPNALHLWGRADGKPVMPDFGQILGSI